MGQTRYRGRLHRPSLALDPCFSPLSVGLLNMHTLSLSGQVEVLLKFPNRACGIWRRVRAGMREFDPFHSSQAFRPSEILPRRRENGPEIPAFRAFDFVSRHLVLRYRGGNRRKSLVLSADIPVLRRLSAETGSIRTAARQRQGPGLASPHSAPNGVCSRR